MIAVLQRVASASVVVEERVAAEIDRGLVVLYCAEASDSDEDAAFFARKIANMRIFDDGEGRMNRSILDVGGAALVVSQFTLAADWRRGNRPSFSGAADPDTGRRLYERFQADLANEGVRVHSGVFGARMEVSLVNDGPVTIVMRSGEA